MSIELATRIGPGYLTTPTFTTMRFPAGEAHVKLANENPGKGPLTEMAILRGADGGDLAMLGMWADASRQRGCRTVALIPYLPGARQDRGLPFGASVYAGIMNSFRIDQVICFDPHSPVMPGLIENLTVAESARMIRSAVVGRADSDERPQRYQGIIAPDAGAAHRAGAVANVCHLPLYLAGKHRDPDTGKLDGFTCEELPETGRFLVVDDICDGGGTFAGLAEATGLGRDRLGLWVSHGVFSGRAAELVQHYGQIHTTDSYPGQTEVPGAVVHPLTPYLMGFVR